MKNNQLIIYQTENGRVKIETHFENETVWLNQAQLGELFQKSKATISEHIKNLFKDGELEEELVVRNFRTTTQHGAIEGKTQTKSVKHYNLDVVISVGYRVKSHRGVHFRKWATALIKEYLIKGFAMNDELLKEAGGGNYFDSLRAWYFHFHYILGWISSCFSFFWITFGGLIKSLLREKWKC